ncbi:hypothetical protein OUZ56_031209 [Daphnia magna]|uniref:Uncharacterized protein n=1 Tax=Daphnia magna TaxID=35525 RepID=A0ABQ9ZTR2_9CRUS|nr:hypothetical protein OUZ56_031209 [Daphnia magna]
MTDIEFAKLFVCFGNSKAAKQMYLLLIVQVFDHSNLLIPHSTGLASIVKFSSAHALNLPLNMAMVVINNYGELQEISD